MHIALVNPQGNFDPKNSYWAEHPDFGGQLVYVKEIAMNLAGRGHRVDILTRRIVDPDWPEFSQPLDAYPGENNVRIVRISCGPDGFLPKEQLWPHLGAEWVPGILKFYRNENSLPNVFSSHYGDGGLAAVLLAQQTGRPFTFTGHSLGAQKMDKLHATSENIAELDQRFAFSLRLPAERLSMNHADQIITSTEQERMQQYGHRAYHGAVGVQDKEKFSVIPPGVNLEIFSTGNGEHDEAISERIERYIAKDIRSPGRDLPVALASSRLDAKKNLTGLVQAFGRSPELQSRANLAIVVRGLEDPLHNFSELSEAEQAIMQEINLLICRYDLEGKITAFPLNSQHELASAYRVLAQRKSVFVLPALYEPFGLAPLEAMSCGLPAAVTQNGGPSESMQGDGLSFAALFDPEDSQDIARGILEVIESDDSWQAYRDAGIMRVLDRYTWQKTAAGYESVFKAISTRGHQPGTMAVPGWFKSPHSENKPDTRDLRKLYLKPD